MRSGLDFVLFLLGSQFPERGQELNARLLRALNPEHLGYFGGARGWGDLGVVQGADQGPEDLEPHWTSIPGGSEVACES